MLISNAYAQAADAGAAAGGDLFTQFAPLLLIFVVFYFLLIRPQQQKMKKHKEMLGSIRRGDRIVTGGGILGVVSKVVNENELQVEIADGVKVRVDRSMVAAVVAKTEAADKTDADNADAGASDDQSGSQSGGKSGGLKKLLGG